MEITESLDHESKCHVCKKNLLECNCLVYVCYECSNVDIVSSTDKNYSKKCAVDGLKMFKVV